MQEISSENKLNERIAALENENKYLHEMVAYLTKKLYGRSSETSKTLNIGQMSLFDEAEIEASDKAKEPTLEDVEAYRRKKFTGQREEKLKNLPHDRVLIKMHQDDMFCETCGTKLTRIGEEFVRTEVEYIPAKLRVIDYYREVYECRQCRKQELPYIEKSVMPEPVIPHSYASASSITHIMYQKYVNAVPLYRQETDWKNLGLKLSRATMANWIIWSADEWLKPLVERMHKTMLEEKYLHADETVMQVMNEPGRKNTTKSYMWVYGTYKDSKTPIRIFEYQPTRSGENARRFLQGFKGYLVSDAYQGYEKVEGIQRCYCWAHLRRYFVEALPKDIKSKEATLPIQAIEYCKELFKIEDEISDEDAKTRYKVRQEKARPILDEFFAWIENNINKTLPKSKLSKAFQYAQNQKEGLLRYLEDGHIAISNNLAENSIRPFTIGRKNWLISGSPKGARASAVVYSIIETAKANGLDPYKYLNYVFKNMPGINQEYYEEFLPWHPDIQRACRKTTQ